MRGVDIKEHEYAPTQADEFLLLDLRKEEHCQAALSLKKDRFDEVYQLATDWVGWGSSIRWNSISCITVP